jgi:hypothetical protein
LSAATSTGSGTLTISTDAGESFSHAISTTFQTLLTGFLKPASVITVRYPGGWTIGLDNISSQKVNAPSPLGTLNASAWRPGTFLVSSTDTAGGAIKIDLSQPDPLTFQLVLAGPLQTTKPGHWDQCEDRLVERLDHHEIIRDRVDALSCVDT